MAAATHPLKIHHKGQDKTLEIRHGLGLQAVAKLCEWIEFDCRRADCGICVVHVKAGGEHLSPPTNAEKDFLKAMHAKADERLACQCRVFGPVDLEVDDYT